MSDIEMRRLAEAREKFREAEKELQKYKEAHGRAVSDRSGWLQEQRNLRQQVRDSAIEYYLGEGDHTENELSELSDRIHKLDGLISAAAAAESQLQAELHPLGNRVQRLERAQSDVATLEALIPEYEKQRKLYPGMYSQAKQIRDAPLMSATHMDDTLRQLRQSRDRLLHLALRLGCEDDAEAFLASVEGESEVK